MQPDTKPMPLLAIDNAILDALFVGRWQTLEQIVGRLAAIGRVISGDKAKVRERLGLLGAAGLVDHMEHTASVGTLQWRLSARARS